MKEALSRENFIKYCESQGAEAKQFGAGINVIYNQYVQKTLLRIQLGKKALF
jgi:hypothetical protein